MHFLVRSHATPAAIEADDDPALDERHWSYMDGHTLIARGPTLSDDRCAWTGSIHVVELPGRDAAHEFVAREPYQQAGAYERHDIWRFDNLLGATMHEFAPTADAARFFVLTRANGHRDPGPVPLADLAPDVRARLIVYGALRDLDDDRPAGVALALQVAGRTDLDRLLADGLGWVSRHRAVEILAWEFGGRR